MLSLYVELLQKVIEWLFQLFLLVLYHKVYYVYYQLVGNTMLIKVYFTSLIFTPICKVYFWTTDKYIVYTVCTFRAKEFALIVWYKKTYKQPVEITHGGVCALLEAAHLRHLLVVVILQICLNQNLLYLPCMGTHARNMTPVLSCSCTLLHLHTRTFHKKIETDILQKQGWVKIRSHMAGLPSLALLSVTHELDSRPDNWTASQPPLLFYCNIVTHRLRQVFAGSSSLSSCPNSIFSESLKSYFFQQ